MLLRSTGICTAWPLADYLLFFEFGHSSLLAPWEFFPFLVLVALPKLNNFCDHNSDWNIPFIFPMQLFPI